MPENTLAAFRHALGAGADGIELDLRATEDGEIVVMHDATVDRTTDGTGEVAAYTRDELKRLDAGAGEQVPTYAEVLELVRGTGAVLLLDIKLGARLDLAEVVRITECSSAMDDVIVGVRLLEDLREVLRASPALRTLGFIPAPDDVRPFAEGGVHALRLWPEWIRARPELIGAVHALGKQVWVTAGDAEEDELDALARAGVDGIISDRLFEAPR